MPFAGRILLMLWGPFLSLEILFGVQHQAFSGQSSPYSLRPPQRTQTPEKQQQQMMSSQSEVAALLFSMLGETRVASCV